MGVRQIYVRDRVAATTTLISKNIPADPGDDDSAAPALDQQGRFVVFQSDATNLVAGDTNGLADIFVYDIWSDRIARVNVNVNSVEADGESLTPTISANGTLIAFVSRALNLVAPTAGEPFPPNRTLDLYMFDNPLLP
jgi:Tol biopolymer transport system component